MTPDQLRALADALQRMADDDSAIPQWERDTTSRAADYLRAQADAQPVAWIAHNLTTGHVKWTTDRCRARGWTRSVNLRVKPLYAHPAPAAPQAEPKRELTAGERDVLDSALRSSVKLVARGVAEPKREPLLGLTPTHRCPACGAFWRQCDDNSWNLRSASCCGLCDAGRVELVRWLDEPKREPLTALLELAEQSDDCQRGTLSTSIVRELVIEALGIGGSDD